MHNDNRVGGGPSFPLCEPRPELFFVSMVYLVKCLSAYINFFNLVIVFTDRRVAAWHAQLGILSLFLSLFLYVPRVCTHFLIGSLLIYWYIVCVLQVLILKRNLNVNEIVFNDCFSLFIILHDILRSSDVDASSSFLP